MNRQPLALGLILSLSCAFAAFADDKEKAGGHDAAAQDNPPSATLVDLIQQREYKAVWASIFNGEYSAPAWIGSLDANSAPVMELTGPDGKKYIMGAMCKASDCANDRFIAAIAGDHKKAWGLGITIPAGLGKEAIAHPKACATLRWYNKPDLTVRKIIMSYVEKDPTWK